MYKNKKILALIPARGGSKTLPRKNILPLAGESLIAWSIKAAFFSKFIDRVIVSTEDHEIATVAKKNGASVPFLRPNGLAQDNSTSIDVVIHTLDTLEEHGESYDFVLLLEPTSPLRKKDDIDNAVRNLIDDDNFDAIVSLGQIQLEHPSYTKKITGKFVSSFTDAPSISRRQDNNKVYFPYGVLYMIKTTTLYKERTFYPKKLMPYLIERWQNYEIDDGLDFFIVENIMKKYKPLT